MAQLLRPISTITDQGSFTGPSAHGSVDGTAPDTGDYWTGNDNQDDVLEVLLTDLSASEPGAGTATVSIYEAEADTDVAPASGGTTATFDIEVYEGTTQRASTTGLNATESTFTLNNSLTFAAEDITDWSDVRVRFTSHGTGGNPGNRRAAAVSYIDISAPDEAGTTFFQTNTGSMTPTGATVKETLKALAGSITPTGAAIKETLKNLAGALTPTGALIKETLKVLAGSMTPTSVLTASKIAFQSVAGALAPTGDLIKETQKALAGALTPTGALIKETLKNVVGELTPTGALIKETLKNLAGALTPTSILAASKISFQNVAGALAPVGTLVKETQKAIAGTLTPVGTLIKETLKNVAGSLTPTSVLDTAITFAKSVAGTLAPITGALTTLFLPGGGGPADVIYRRYVAIMNSTMGRGSRRR